jgi:hypothetical protein
MRGCRSLVSLSQQPSSLSPEDQHRFFEEHPGSPIFDPWTGRLVPWFNASNAQVSLFRPDGTSIVVCWWVIKGLLLPECPCRLVVAKPQSPTLREPHRVPGVSHAQDGSVEGPNHMGRRRTIAYRSS